MSVAAMLGAAAYTPFHHDHAILWFSLVGIDAIHSIWLTGDQNVDEGIRVWPQLETSSAFVWFKVKPRVFPES